MNLKNSLSSCPASLTRVGTSGYSYPEWSDAGFYPQGTPAREMLALYARQFPITELNYTWYHMPKAAAMERMLPLLPPGFSVAAKLTRTLTHEVDPHAWRGQAAQFREGIAPLIQAQRLVALLVQLPPAFERSDSNRRYLALLLDELTGLPLAVEFRHRSWAVDRVFAELERRLITLVTVDVPDLPYLFPSLEVVTNPDLFYVRFHGRNARGWRSGNMQKQFDYLYSAAELHQWSQVFIPKLTTQAHSGIMIFNNHVRAQAPRNAQMLSSLMRSLGDSMIRSLGHDHS